MVEYTCEVCVCTFKTKQHYNSHIVSRKHIMRTEQKNDMFVCEFCDQAYSHASSLSRHVKNVHKATAERTLQDQITTMKEEFEKEKEELRAQISLLLDKYADTQPSICTGDTGNHHNTNIQNKIDTQTNIENQNIENQNNIDNLTNIVVNIDSFGNENIEYLDDDTVIDCIKQLHNSVPAIIEKVHFHPKHPENHNIQVTNKKLPYAKVMGENQKWKTMNRSDAIDRMITNGYNILDDTYEEHKDKLSEFKQTVFEDFQKKYLDDDKQTHKKLRTNVDTLILNGGST